MFSSSRWHQTGRIEPVIPRAMALGILEEGDVKKVDGKLCQVDSEAEVDQQVSETFLRGGFRLGAWN